MIRASSFLVLIVVPAGRCFTGPALLARWGVVGECSVENEAELSPRAPVAACSNVRAMKSLSVTRVAATSGPVPFAPRSAAFPLVRDTLRETRTSARRAHGPGSPRDPREPR